MAALEIILPPIHLINYHNQILLNVTFHPVLDKLQTQKFTKKLLEFLSQLVHASSACLIPRKASLLPLYPNGRHGCER